MIQKMQRNQERKQKDDFFFLTEHVITDTIGHVVIRQHFIKVLPFSLPCTRRMIVESTCICLRTEI